MTISTMNTGFRLGIHVFKDAEVVDYVGGALSMVLADLLDGDYTQWRRVMDNCAVSELVIEPQPALLSFNHTAHLDDL